MRKRPLCMVSVICLIFQMFRIYCTGMYLYGQSAAEKAAEQTNRITVTGTVCRIEKKENSAAAVLQNCAVSCACDEPKSVPARNLGDRLQSRNVPFGTFGDFHLEKNENFKILVYINPEKYREKIRPGNTIEVSGTPKLFEKAKNPGNFDQRIYYKKQNIEMMLFADNVRILSGQTDFLAEKLLSLKNGWKQILVDHLGEYYGGIMSAILLGDKSSLDSDVKLLYQKCGIGHVLAVSGLHMSFLGMGLYRGMRRMGAGFILAGTAGGTILILYLYMIGPGVSSTRALLMFLIRLGAEMTGRDYDLPTSLFLSAAVMCTVQPLYIFDAAFQLSFGAILGIYLLSPVFCSSLQIDRIQNGMIAKLLKSTGTSTAVTVFLLGPVLYFYHETSPYSVWLNLIVIPLLPAAMAAGVAGPALYLIWEPAGIGVLKICRIILWVYDKVCETAGRLPFCRFVTGIPSGLFLLLYYLILATLYLLYVVSTEGGYFSSDREDGKRRVKMTGWVKKYTGIAMLLTAVSGAVLCRAGYRMDDNLSVTVLDVGQGDSIHISSGGENWLIDGGSNTVAQTGTYRIEPYLLAQAADSLDYVIATHGDEDHISGIREMVENQKFGVKIRNLVIPSEKFCDRNLLQLAEMAERAGIRVISAAAGSSLSSESSKNKLSLSCIGPGADTHLEAGNQASLVFYLQFNRFRMILTGDVEGEGEKYLLKNGLLKECDVLKVAHHGSENSGSEEFLKKVLPKAAVISCGKNNSYGHPHKETLERLERINCRIYITGSDGAVRILTDGEQMRILPLSK